MAFWQKCLLILLSLQQVAEAQSILMIEDQTESGFKLVMNNFIQNETALPKLNLQKFPTTENEVIIILNSGLRIQQKLPAFKKGIHKYVIYRDYSGATKLRYRGVYNDLSQSALMFDYSEAKAWIENGNQNLAQNDTNSRYEEWKNENLKAQKIESSDSLISIATVKVDPNTALANEETMAKSDSSKEPSKPTLLVETSPITDSVLVSKADSLIAPKAKPYLSFNTKFLNSSFEFDKVQMAKDYGSEEEISEEQMVEILSSLKYDQSRIDLLRTLLPKQEHLLQSEAKLIACLDYDLSKQEAKKLFKQ